MVHVLVAGQVGGSNGLPTWLMEEVEPEPKSYTAACKNQYSEVRKKWVEVEFAVSAAAGTFTEVSEAFSDCDAVESQRVHQR